jgi:hypothetical protein
MKTKNAVFIHIIIAVEESLKWRVMASVAAMLWGFSPIWAAGGMEPCLATCFMGDTRIGLYMNDKQPIESNDWLRFGGSFIPCVGCFFPLYTSYTETENRGNFCVALLWGHRAGREFDRYRLRDVEVLRCIPIANIYAAIALSLEAYEGKTMTQVIREEGLAR